MSTNSVRACACERRFRCCCVCFASRAFMFVLIIGDTVRSLCLLYRRAWPSMKELKVAIFRRGGGNTLKGRASLVTARNGSPPKSVLTSLGLTSFLIPSCALVSLHVKYAGFFTYKCAVTKPL